jgi:TonB family protein
MADGKLVRGFAMSAALLVVTSQAATADPLKGPGDADYPLEALAQRQQGTALTDLSVGTNGRVSDCTITVSSNSPVLDKATCNLLTVTARFEPARDGNGKTTVSHVPGEVTWVIPECPKPSQTDPRLLAQIQVHVTITSLERCH